jgi:hypothetical protein
MPALYRNRDFVLLELGRLLSGAGSQASAIAYPLLALAVTGSAAKAGIVGFARVLPQALFGLLAGAAADRWNRKWLMIGADLVRALAVGALGGLVLSGAVRWWSIPVVAFVEGAGSAVFGAASAGALKAVVPAQQLPTAVGAQRARMSTLMLAGPPVGGALFELGRAVPFLADAASYAFSFASLAAMRTPFQEARERESSPLHVRIAEGLRFMWRNAFVRTCALIYALGNPLMPGVLLALVVVGRRQGLSGGEIGLLVAALGAAALVGSLASPLARRALPIRTIIVLELWTWLGCWVFVAWPTVYALLAVVVPFGLCAPVTDSVVEGYRVALTPDRLLGRVEAARSTVALLILPLGPLAAGLLLDVASARATIAVFALVGLGLAVWGTFSPVLRRAPRLADLDAAAPAPAAAP